MTLLVDFGDVRDDCCGTAFEALFKAMAEPAPNDEGIWAPAENPWLRFHLEAVTHRLQAILQAMQDALARFLGGHAGVLQKADVPWLRWDEARFEEVRRRLTSMGPDRFELDDWMLLVDYLIQRYLPDDVITAESEYLAIRATLLGKIQANLANSPRVNDAVIAQLSLLLPTDFAAVPPKVLSPLENSVLRYASAHAAENVRDLTATARHAMSTVVLEHVQAAMLGQKEGAWKYLQTRLFDQFGLLNRDMRRIAVTEGGEALNQGFVAAVEPGRRLKRIEAYRGACEFCKSINGRVFTVVSPTSAEKDGDVQVWTGKTNVGRSASPRKREGGHLVARVASEMWWPAAGVQHPHCRGSWVAVTDTPPRVRPEFAAWMAAKLAEAERAAGVRQ